MSEEIMKNCDTCRYEGLAPDDAPCRACIASHHAVTYAKWESTEDNRIAEFRQWLEGQGDEYDSSWSGSDMVDNIINKFNEIFGKE